MRPRDLADLLMLAALWGASFLFIRLGAAEFGPVALAALRCTGAALFLLPILAWRGQAAALRAHWRAIAVVGVLNSALPFSLYGVALLAINSGLSAIFNAATPLWAAAIGALWLHERLGPMRVLGLSIGLAGVVGLAWDKAGLATNEHGVSAALAIAACLGATALYGYAACFARKRLAGVPPMALATGSQLSAAIVLAAPALWLRPVAAPGATAWIALALLAVLCTGVAYILYFRLIAHTGATNASAVTFLIPLFAAFFGWLVLDEALTPSMVIGAAVILAGTALAMGLLPRPAARQLAS
ncbi:MAG TPA: DMT family transporter [Burkholderiaceae bacterium]|nr:DMT family transporter [Burkholderiaceae bacterium]